MIDTPALTLGEQIDAIAERVTELLSELDEKNQQIASLAKAFAPFRAWFVPFNEHKQAFYCRVCLFHDPLGPDGTKLHDDNCPMLAMIGLLERGQ